MHKRGGEGPSLLVIEAKKDTSRRSDKDDLEKLKFFQANPGFRYEHTLFIRFSTSPPGIEDVRWIEGP